MNRFAVNKLHLSKWTAAEPENKEKHFLVTAVHRDELEKVVNCTLEAVHSKRELLVTPTELRDSEIWLMGWQ